MFIPYMNPIIIRERLPHIKIGLALNGDHGKAVFQTNIKDRDICHHHTATGQAA